jgi:hypothetical protein
MIRLYAAAFSCRWHDGTIRIEAASIRGESQEDAEWIGLKYFREKYPNGSHHLCVVDEILPQNIPDSYYSQPIH